MKETSHLKVVKRFHNSTEKSSSHNILYIGYRVVNGCFLVGIHKSYSKIVQYIGYSVLYWNFTQKEMMSMSFILQNYMADKDSIIDELNRKLRDSVNLHDVCIQLGLGLKVFNATFNNISVILWRSVLLAEESRAPRILLAEESRAPRKNRPICRKSRTNFIT